MSALADLLSPADWAQLTAALCVGGPVWRVSRAGAGDGITAPVGAPRPAGTITAAIYRAQTPVSRRAQAGTPVPEAPWHMTIQTGSVQIGDQVTSQADARWVFRVTELPDQPGDAMLVERVR